MSFIIWMEQRKFPTIIRKLDHSDVSTTMNVYAHSTRKAKRESVRLLDKAAGND